MMEFRHITSLCIEVLIRISGRTIQWDIGQNNNITTMKLTVRKTLNVVEIVLPLIA